MRAARDFCSAILHIMKKLIATVILLDLSKQVVGRLNDCMSLGGARRSFQTMGGETFVLPDLTYLIEANSLAAADEIVRQAALSAGCPLSPFVISSASSTHIWGINPIRRDETLH